MKAALRDARREQAKTREQLMRQVLGQAREQFGLEFTKGTGRKVHVIPRPFGFYGKR